VVLFVRLRDGVALDDALRERIKRALRDNTTPPTPPTTPPTPPTPPDPSRGERVPRAAISAGRSP
jgi:acetoacetyl-CoA synthetase